MNFVRRRRLVFGLALGLGALCAANVRADAVTGRVVEREARSVVGTSVGIVEPLPAASPVAGNLQARVVGFRRAGSALRVRLELGSFLTDRWRRAVHDGTTLYVRIETELWEKRSVWDRLVQAAAVSLARITADANGTSIVVVDAFGRAENYPIGADAIAVWADLVGVNRVDDQKQYYVHAAVAVGTIAESQIAGMSDAVFGERSGGGLGALGRLVFQKVLRLADYLDSSSCDVTGPAVRGADLRRAP